MAEYTLDSEPTRKRKRTGKTCCVYGCSVKNSDGVSIHHFPSDPSLRRQWVYFVKTRRANFDQPTANTVVCERHFAPECYPVSYRLRLEMGLEVKKKELIPGSIPSIQMYMNVTTATASNCSVSTTVTTSSLSSSSSTTVTSASQRPVVSATVYQLPGTSKPRGAYEKREHQRALKELLLAAEAENIGSDMEVENCPPADTTAEFGVQAAETQTPNSMFWRPQKPVKMVMKSSKRTQVTANIRHKGTQVPPVNFSHKHTQCNMDLTGAYKPMQSDPNTVQSPSSPGPPSNTTTPSNTPVKLKVDRHDPDWHPTPACTESDAEVAKVTDCEQKEEKYIVYRSQLLKLFLKCSKCGQATLREVFVRGSFVRIQQECSYLKCRAKITTWDSQPFVKDVPAGNMLMSAAILFSGSIPSKVLRFLRHVNVASVSAATFFEHQSAALFPAVQAVWDRYRKEYLEDLKDQDKSLCLGGDGRADTPGHCAKYGTYTTQDLDLMKVVDVQVVQSNVAGGSARMELKGLQRSVADLKKHGLSVKELVTDRHPSVIKWVREEMKETRHSFDVWHVAKGLKKKLVKLSNEKECGDLQLWIKSICNHLYWVAVSTPEANKPLMQAKWQSLLNHLHNRHQHESAIFPGCLHQDLSGTERKKKWLKAGTKLSAKLADILETKMLLRDVAQLATGPQTAAIEGFHSVLNHFAPKMIGFSYYGMLNRNLIAALHFNENNERAQATTADGTGRYTVGFRKGRKSFSLQETKVDCTYDYADKLIAEVFKLAEDYSLQELKKRAAEMTEPAPPPICADFEHMRPNLQDAIEQHVTRYKSV